MSMVVPIHTQQDWSECLSKPSLFAPGDGRMLVLAPHPDDETLAAGGLIAAQRERGIQVSLVAVTDGENAYAENAGLRDRRADEQSRAAACLGVAAKDITRLHLPDRNVKSSQNDLVDRLLPITTHDTHLVAPWPHDFHPDHEACGEAALAVAQRTGARLTFYFFWTWHRGTPALFDSIELQSFPLTGVQRAAKEEALAQYNSQLSHPSGDPILHDIHLWPARMPFEVFLPHED